MPAKSRVQQQMMGADLARLRAGKETRTGMTASQLREFAGTKHRGLPKRRGGSRAIRYLMRKGRKGD